MFVVSGIMTVIGSFLVYIIAKYIQKDFPYYPSFKYDLVVSLCIIFGSTYLLFSVSPFLTEMAKYSVRHAELYDDSEYWNWFKVLGITSIATVIPVYIIGIHAIVKWLSGQERLRGRRLYYLTVGVFLFAVWMFVIQCIVFWTPN